MELILYDCLNHQIAEYFLFLLKMIVSANMSANWCDINMHL